MGAFQRWLEAHPSPRAGSTFGVLTGALLFLPILALGHSGSEGHEGAMLVGQLFAFPTSLATLFVPPLNVVRHWIPITLLLLITNGALLGGLLGLVLRRRGAPSQRAMLALPAVWIGLILIVGIFAATT